MKGLYTERVELDKLPFSEILNSLLPGADSLFAEQFFDDGDGEVKEYCVYKLKTQNGTYIVKKSIEKETFIYKNFFLGKVLPVPKFLGSSPLGEDEWIAVEYIEGPDLRNFSEESVFACAESFSEIANSFWGLGGDPNGRYEEYLRRIEKRSQCLKNEPELLAAYSVFIERQKTCPKTLCNGDFIPFNGIFQNGEKVIIIDWEYGGALPYSLDVARLVAHGNETGNTLFYITPELRELYIDRVYELLEEKPCYGQYRRDVDLALLNEYVEMIEPGLNDPKDKFSFFEYYYALALAKAKEIME